MSQGAHVKSGRVYVVRAYSKKWKQNAFFTGMVNGKPDHTKFLKKAKEYKLEHNAKKAAERVTEASGVVHRHAIRY